MSHFRIVSEIGNGAMGIVYKAEDILLGRTVALKFLHPQLASSNEARARFVVEAKAAASIDHPNVGTIYEIGQITPEITDADVQPFIVMAYHDGKTIEAHVARGPMSVEDALDVAIQTARGLGAAHHKGISHRDIKPGNLIWTSSGLIKIVDFGLAKFDGCGLTKMGSALGSAAYMSPEQVRGDGVDHRSDIWSLGVVLYEIVSGRRPFVGDYETAVLYSILNCNPAPLRVFESDIPPVVDEVVSRCLQKDPAKRYGSAAILERELMRAKAESHPVWRRLRSAANSFP